MSVKGIQIKPRLIMQTSPLYDEIEALKVENRELKASAAEAHLFIDALAVLIKSRSWRTAKRMVAEWEDSQC